MTTLMAKKPEDRYQTPAESVKVLEDALRGRSAIRPAAASPGPCRQTCAKNPFKNLDGLATLTTPEPTGRHRRLLIAGIASAILLLAVVILAVWLLSRPAKPDAVAGASTSAATGSETPPPKGLSAEQIEAARKLGVRVQLENSIGMKLI